MCYFTVEAWVRIGAPLAAAALLVRLPPSAVWASLALPYATLALFAWLCRFLRRPDSRACSTEPGQLDPYEVAYLSGGERLAVDAAVTGLVHGEVLRVEVGNRKLQLCGRQPGGSRPLEQAILSAIDPGTGSAIEEIRRSVTPAIERLRGRLRELGLVLSKARARTLEVLVLLLSCSNVLVGWMFLLQLVPLLRDGSPDGGIPTSLIAIGIDCGWATLVFVGFLLVCCVPIGIAGELVRSDRTREGDRMLQVLKRRHSVLDLAADQDVEELESDDLVMALTLFDVGAPSHGNLGELRSALEPLSASDADGDAGEDFDSCGDE